MHAKRVGDGGAVAVDVGEQPARVIATGGQTGDLGLGLGPLAAGAERERMRQVVQIVGQGQEPAAEPIPFTDGAMRVAAVALATLIVERIISVHGISEHFCPATKQVVPEVIGTVVV